MKKIIVMVVITLALVGGAFAVYKMNVPVVKTVTSTVETIKEKIIPEKVIKEKILVETVEC